MLRGCAAHFGPRNHIIPFLLVPDWPETAPRDLAHLTEGKHFGLAGIAERVESIHGEWEIISHQGAGTTIRMQLPIIPQD